MNRTFSRLAGAAIFALTFMAAVEPAWSQSFTPSQREEIGTIIREYLLAHPELLQDIASELEKKQSAADAAKALTAVKNNAELIFNSPRQIVLGNSEGDVTLVEFFDYNCGYCKRAMADMIELVKTDGKLRYVLKEFPVLGEGSVEAALVSAAVRMQDKTGRKSLEFHQKLLGGRGEANKARALAVAKDIGMDMARIEKDFASKEARATIDESFKLAKDLSLNGTPSYVVGTSVVVGAVGLAALREKINEARCGKATC